jgi:hypothetical protein
MAKATGSVKSGTIQNARLSRTAKVLYPYHPLFGQELEVLGSAGGQRDVVYVILPDRTTRGVPGWMFDEVVCSTVRLAKQPAIDVGALLRLAQLLDSFLKSRPNKDDENKPCSQAEVTSPSTTIASSSAVGVCGAKPTNPGAEPDQVRAVAARATGECPSSVELQPRRQR